MVLITFTYEYECIITGFKALGSPRQAGKNRMVTKPVRLRDRQGSQVVLCSVLFSHFTFIYACPIIMSLPFMIESSMVKSKVVYRCDERNRRLQLHSKCRRICAQEHVF